MLELGSWHVYLLAEPVPASHEAIRRVEQRAEVEAISWKQKEIRSLQLPRKIKNRPEGQRHS